MDRNRVRRTGQVTGGKGRKGGRSRVETIFKIWTLILTPYSRLWSHDSGVNSNRLGDLYCRLHDFCHRFHNFSIGCVILRS